MAAPVILILLALLSWVRIREWKDNRSFFAAEAGYHPDSTAEHLNLTSTLIGRGEYDLAERTLAQAAKTPDIADRGNLAKKMFLHADMAVRRDGDLSTATQYLEKALVLKPDGLGYVFGLAVVRALDNRLDQSMIILRKAHAAPWFDAHQKQSIREQVDLMREQYKNGPPARKPRIDDGW